MAWVVGVIGLVASVGGSVMGNRGSRRAGKAAQAAKEYEAKQYEQNAGQAVAASQRDMLEERRRAKLIASRAQAVAASSGAGVSDPTVLKIMGDLEGEGAYREALAMYRGEDEARQLRERAKAARLEGEAARRGLAIEAKANTVSAIGGALQQGAGLYGRYAASNRTTQPPRMSGVSGPATGVSPN